MDGRYITRENPLYNEIAKIANTDYSSYETFFNLSVNYLYQMVLQLVSDNESANEIINKVYEEIYAKIGELHTYESFYVWAGGIATAVSLQYITEKNPETITSFLDTISAELTSQQFDFSQGKNLQTIPEHANEDDEKFVPDDFLVRDESKRLLQKKLDQLSITETIILQKYYYDEQSVTKIAFDLNSSTEVVKSALSHIKEELKSVITTAYGEDYANNMRLSSLSEISILWGSFAYTIYGSSASSMAVNGFVSAGAVDASDEKDDSDKSKDGMIAGTLASNVVSGASEASNAVGAGMVENGMISGTGMSNSTIGIGMSANTSNAAGVGMATNAGNAANAVGAGMSANAGNAANAVGAGMSANSVNAANAVGAGMTANASGVGATASHVGAGIFGTFAGKVAIGVVAAAIVGCGTATAVHVANKGKDKDKENKETSVEATVETSEEETTATTTEEATTEEVAVDYQTPYIALLDTYHGDCDSYTWQQGYDGSATYPIGICDITGDDVPELFIMHQSTDNQYAAACEIYTLDESGNAYKMCSIDNMDVQAGGGESYAFFTTTDGKIYKQSGAADDYVGYSYTEGSISNSTLSFESDPVISYYKSYSYEDEGKAPEYTVNGSDASESAYITAKAEIFDKIDSLILYNENTTRDEDMEGKIKTANKCYYTWQEAYDILSASAPTASSSSESTSSASSAALPFTENVSMFLSSGVGAWQTSLELAPDGSFSGEYTDADMGDSGTNYPNGTRYISNFSGTFTDIEKIDDYTYSMKLGSLEYEDSEDEWYEDGVRYIKSGAYGIEEGTTFMLYLPGKPVSELPEGYTIWLWDTSKTSLDNYGLYNVDGELGFQ